MGRLWRIATLALIASSPISAQRPPVPAPVQATLRLEGSRTSFKSGEPIRLQLELAASEPGFVADVAGTDDQSDVLTIRPEAGVTRMPQWGWRDYRAMQPLSGKLLPINLTACSRRWPNWRPTWPSSL